MAIQSAGICSEAKDGGLLVLALRTASLWFSFDVMPGMVVLISACRIFGGQLFGFNFSLRYASVVRMSACSFCYSFIRWFKLFF